MLSKFDIFEIIDKAIEKKDRYVTIYISKNGDISVNCYPITEDETEFEAGLKEGLTDEQ